VNSYAAAYNDGGDLVIAFGADRFANNGSAQLGFWFLQNGITQNANGTFGGPHSIGDLLVLVNFNQGGGVPSIDVLKWTGGKNPLTDLTGNVSAECPSLGANGAVCAITNAGPVDLFWPSAFKFPSATACPGIPGAASCAPPVSFFEGALDVTALLGSGNTPCISSFLAETRSSTSVTASLEDFSLHSFNVCGMTVSKSCPSGGINSTGDGFSYNYRGSVTNTGFGSLSNVVVTDTYPTSPSATGTATYTIGALAAGATAYFPGPDSTGLASFNSSVNGPVNSASATGSAGNATTNASTTAQCPTIQVSPSLAVSKQCHVNFVAQGGNIVTRIDFSGTVSNTSSVELTGLSVVDVPSTAVTLSATTLHPQGHTTNGVPDDVATYSGTYFPSSLPTNTDGRFTFMDQVTASASSGIPGATVTPQSASRSCPVCGIGQCSTTQNP
jgi:hypothetical protein